MRRAGGLGALGEVGERPFVRWIDGDRTRLVTLPERGEVLIGSDEEAEVRLPAELTAPRHAVLSAEGEAVRLRELSRACPLRVNGEVLTGTERLLVGGDTITLGSVTLVFHSPGVRSPRVESALGAFRAQAALEIERSLRTRLAFSLLALRLGRASAEAVSGALRALDLTCWDAPDQLLVLLPGTDGEGGRAVAQRLLDSMGSAAPEARVSHASFPADGCDVDSLLAQVRAATLRPEGERVRHAVPARQRIVAGEQEVVVADPAMFRLYALLERLARAELTVLICGETGSGKELVAATLHHRSPRRESPFVTVNCAALPEPLLESELFGHERGAFSGADTTRPGLIATADRGTLLLDEVGDLPLGAQAKLLRVLESKRVRGVGSVRERAVDVRILAATNRELEDEVSAGRFRRDLYYRLRGTMVRVPPLRERPSEIPALAAHLLGQACARLGRPPMRISGDALVRLLCHDWPGNVRELRSLVDFAAAVGTGPTVQLHQVEEWIAAHRSEGPPPGAPGRRLRPLHEEIEELERRRIHEAMSMAGGNQVAAARLIAMPLRTFRAKLKRYRLQGVGRERPV